MVIELVLVFAGYALGLALANLIVEKLGALELSRRVWVVSLLWAAGLTLIFALTKYLVDPAFGFDGDLGMPGFHERRAPGFYLELCALWLSLWLAHREGLESREVHMCFAAAMAVRLLLPMFFGIPLVK